MRFQWGTKLCQELFYRQPATFSLSYLTRAQLCHQIESSSLKQHPVWILPRWNQFLQSCLRQETNSHYVATYKNGKIKKKCMRTISILTLGDAQLNVIFIRILFHFFSLGSGLVTIWSAASFQLRTANIFMTFCTPSIQQLFREPFVVQAWHWQTSIRFGWMSNQLTRQSCQFCCAKPLNETNMTHLNISILFKIFPMEKDNFIRLQLV